LLRRHDLPQQRDLMLVFRSVRVPIKAAGGFLLSIAAAMGAVVWVF
jgi:putative drug exporter of the RND superfamily